MAKAEAAAGEIRASIGAGGAMASVAAADVSSEEDGAERGGGIDIAESHMAIEDL